MIRLSKLTDYAIVVMSEMARHVGTVHTVSHLAERTGVPSPTVAKLMKTLTPAGLTTSHRGAAGGYALSRSADAISIAEIITALDGPIALTACVEGGDSQCGVQRLCPMRGGWEKVNSAIRGALEQVTLADMMGPPAWADGPPGPLDKIGAGPVPARRAAV
ncbi:SUF system Fe-S cluster assembly regulator [Azospirillum sp. YIM DDC1]|uniref:SUF system Fe-S cluster assembly regulator n=1 Tax=Azospirillum aestuarii TaxID=2802052 RepID=A0ABS1HSU2_9PROT|nr:SUF system Fe-S cluster assembly regulator [Azospirillum aestuarii]MBK3772605.1 SUF system Fe-S cluster assembly regulator [Azospirillum brasilense]MBK4717899.1 SUF system Fe-S cluster assembly regulator [Azospirillum aestuarii]TWA93083.1 BadM/Rrf2 family transcriptional regulator [Azospirillum brasilense]